MWLSKSTSSSYIRANPVIFLNQPRISPVRCRSADASVTVQSRSAAWSQHLHLFGRIHGNASGGGRSEEHTSELQSRGHLVCRLLLEKKKKKGILTQKRTLLLDTMN